MVKALRSHDDAMPITSVRGASENIHFDDAAVGDIAFFHRVGDVPSHAVISRRDTNGSFRAITITGKKIREIRIHLNRPSQRRLKNQVINSFLRVKRVGDKTNGYLAGELLREIRRPLFLL